MRACLIPLAFASLACAQQPPYSWRGSEGRGVFPAGRLVTGFHDLAPDMVTEAKDAQGREPVGHQGHMGPGGTPVVMNLGGAGYGSWVAHGDVVFANFHQGLYAVRLALAGERLEQALLWRLDGETDARAPNLAFHDGRLYAAVSREKRRGIAAVDPATGRIAAWGPTSGGHDTALAFAQGMAVWPTDCVGDRTEGKSNPAATPGHGMTSYAVVALPDLKPLGKGYLCPEAPAGEVRERHIARIGTARTVWGNAGITAWGNRIFVRNNDYLWCIGDPAEPWSPPEAFRREERP